MIEKTIAYKTSEGTMVSTIEEAKKIELRAIFPESDDAHWTSATIAECIIADTELIIDILTMKPTSKPKARAVNGGKKTRKPKASIAPPPIE